MQPDPSPAASAAAGHTPGPWSVDGDGIRAMVRGANGKIIAVRHRATGPQNEADMRLIASAPDLLAALRAAEQSLAAVDAAWRKEPLGASEIALGAAMPGLREALDAARSAIALTDGGARHG